MVQFIINSKLLILSLIYLSFFNQLVICSEGVFQIHIKRYTLFSTLNLTKCCANSNNSTKSCSNDCNIIMEICLSVYQENPHRYACDIGETVIKTDILGNDKLNEMSKRDYSITVKERWQTDFNILVKIKHRNLANKKDVLIVTLSSSERDVKPSSSWITKQLSTPKDHFQLNVSFRYFCSKYYHGEKCDKLCKPSANERGFYNCSSNGDRICHAGYSGVYCDQVVCLKKCIHGTCVGPNQCRCLTGWGGNSCDKCIPYPGCIHGGCRLDENTKELLPLTCQCQKKWGGMFCNIDLNYCANNPNVCENGGECQNFGNITTNQQYRCICKPGFKGAHCEKVEANCLIRKCLNGGQCEIESRNNQSKCKCEGSFYGDRCQFNQTSCDDNPCVSKNSVCLRDKQNGFKCKCSKGFTGRNCEIDVDECSNKPCSNGGMCIDRPGGFLCVCPVGFSGDRCQINKNDCQKLSCMNGARCMDKANRIDCECTSGWTGNLCDQNINECAINQPCLNNGKCIDTPGSYQCLCQPLWSGKHCNLKIVNPNKNLNEKRCLINPCGQNGICLINSKLSFENSQTDDTSKSIGGPYKCKCNPGFTGEFCEKVIIANGSIIIYSDSQVTTIPFIYRNPINHRPMTLILLIIIAIGVPTIIVIIVSFLCCSKCHGLNKSKSDYQKNCKNESIIERTNIKILNNKLHRNQQNPYLMNNEKIPLSMTKLNNEIINNETCIPRYQCSHNMKISNVPFSNYQCHISSLPSQLINSNNNSNNNNNNINNNNNNKNNNIGSQLNSNLILSKIHSINSTENDEKYFHKSLSSVRDGEPESQYQNSFQIKSIDKDNFQSSMDLEHYEKSNYKSSRGFDSAMLYRKSNSNLTQDLCSSHNSLLDAALKQNLRTAVSQQFPQPNVLPIVENEDCNFSGKSFNNNSRTSLTTKQTLNLAWPIIDSNFSKNPTIISNCTNPSSSDNRMIIYNSRSVKPQKLNYNLISHPHFKETSCFFDSNLNFSSIKSNKTDSTLIDDYSSTKM